jgi:hypothetical protein
LPEIEEIEMYCVFADLLGFSAITRGLPSDSTFVWNETPGHERYPSTPAENLAVAAQSALHQFWQWQSAMPLRKPVKPEFQALFSDCGFVLYKNIEPAIAYAVNLMRIMVGHFIPIRCGIAEGSFLIWSRDATNEPWLMHNAIFLGSAITRSAEAERSPQKGLGIFIDDSALAAIRQTYGEGSVVRLENSRGTCSNQLDWGEISLPEEYIDFLAASCWVNKFSKKRAASVVKGMGEAQAAGDPRIMAHYESTVRMFGLNEDDH